MYVFLFQASTKEDLFSSLERHRPSATKRFIRIGEGPFRASFCLRELPEFPSKVALLRSRAEKLEQYFSLADGVFFCSRTFSADGLAFLFPGQGSQTPRMFENYFSYDAFARSFDRMNTRASDQGIPLHRLLYEDSQSLDQTQNAQPALAAVSWSLVELLGSHGIRAKRSAGHSFGELVALAHADAYSPDFLLDLSVQRGQLMAQANEDAPGKMLAVVDKVSRDWKTLHQRVSEDRALGSVSLANINSPTQLVYSGTSDEILLLRDRCQERQLRCTILSASAAFHSPLMIPAAKKFEAYLRAHREELRAPDSSVVSNLPEFSYESADDVAENLPRLLASQVRWIEVVEHLFRDGVRVFLELGPKSVLSRLVEEILPGGQAIVASVDGNHPLEAVLAQLACLGLEPHFTEATEAPFSWELQTENKIISGYLARQKNLLEEAKQVRDPELRKGLQLKVMADVEEVLHLFFSLDGKAPSPVQPPRSAPSDEFTLAVVQEISSITGFRPEEIDPEARFDSDLALDSITRMELLSSLSRNFKTEVSDVSALMSANSISELTRTLRSFGSALKVKSAEPLPEDLLWVRQKIAQYTGVEESKIHLATRFSEDLMLDSLIKMELLSGLQERRGKLDFDDFTLVNSLADLEALLSSRISESQAQRGPEKKITSFLRERLATYLGLAPGKLLTTSSFEHDLGLSVFEKEDLVKSVVHKFPYLALAGRELLHADSLGDLLELEALLDRRSSTRSADEEIVRFSFVSRPVGRSKLRQGSFPERVIVCTLTGTEVSRVLGYLDGKTRVTFVPVLDHLELLRILEAEPTGATVDLLFIVPPLLTRTNEEWDAQLDRFLSFLFFFAGLFDLFRSRQLNLRLKLLLDGSKDLFSRSVVGICRSIVREYPLTFDIVDMEWAANSPERLPWGLLWPSDPLPTERCRHYRMEKQRFEQEILEPTPVATTPTLTLPEKTRVLMIGGSRGIAAVVAKKLAGLSAARIFCVGRTDLSHVSYTDITDPEVLRSKIEEEISRSHKDLSAEEQGKLSARKYSTVLRQREILETKASVERRGGEFHYFCQDALDLPGLSKLIANIEAEFGPMNGVIHAAGITRDSLIKNKKFDDFKEVVVTKVRSARNLYHIFQDRTDLSFVTFFSSLSSWSGAPGQTDYALANEMLNVLAESWNQRAPFPVSALLWSVWSEAGLASASLLQQMKALGLTGISNRAGVRLFTEELRSGFKSPKVLFSPRSTLEYSLKVPSI